MAVSSGNREAVMMVAKKEAGVAAAMAEGTGAAVAAAITFANKSSNVEGRQWQWQ